MTSGDPALAPQGLHSNLRRGALFGGAVGLAVGLLDGVLAALGLDASLFLLHVDLEGLVPALTANLPHGSDVWSSFTCVLAAAALHAIAFALVGGLLTALLGKLFGWSARHVGTLLLGVWLGALLFWWTRPVVFPGLSSADPRRLAATGAILVAGLGLAWIALWLSDRLPPWLLRFKLGLGWLVLILGSVFLVRDFGSAKDRGQLHERNNDLPNVVLFVVDALRHDVLSCYGSPDVQTPNIDSIAARGVLFERAFVQAPFTWTSFGSILTGKYPRRHGLIKMAPGVRMGANVTLPFHLQGAVRKADGVALNEGDYVGAAFMTGTLSHGSGLLRGFDVYLEALVGHGLVDVHRPWSKFRSKLMVFGIANKLGQKLDQRLVATAAADWIAEHADRRFVSMVHYYSTHTPYDPIEPFRSEYLDEEYDGVFDDFYAEHRIAIEAGQYEPTEADRERIRELYRAGTAQADAMIGQVIDQLKASGIYDDTIVVVTSDHGEELGEHDLWEHNFMYQTNLQVPLIVSAPGRLPEGVRVQSMVESVDLLPTLCELIGVELPVDTALGERGRLDGVSLVDVAKQTAQPGAPALRVKDWIFAENGRYRSIHDETRKLIVVPESLVDGGFERLIAGELPRPRFFDLATDPGELQNVFEERAQDARELWTALKAMSDTMPIGNHMIHESARDLEAEQRFQSLGYTEGGIGAEPVDGDAQDPKRPADAGEDR